MTNASIEPEPLRSLANSPLAPATRQRLHALLKDELARASAEAQAKGTPTEILAKQLEERIAELRRQITAANRDAQL